MSAISGILSLNRERIPHRTAAQFDKVLEVQKHRGPAATHVCAFDFDGNVSFAENVAQIGSDFGFQGLIGHNLLHIHRQKLSTHTQPFLNSDGTVGIAYDGQFFNIAAIKDDLLTKGHRFASETEEEVLLCAYAEYGIEEMARRINGLFAFVLFDLKRHVLHLVCDRYGAKPLYYTVTDGQLLFASELKGLIQTDALKRELDIDACNARLIFARTGSRVLLKGVKLLAPAEILTVSNGTVSSTVFFSYDSYQRNEHMFQTTEDAIAATEELIDKVIARQMEKEHMSIQLSGGIDSTLLAYYAKKHEPENFSGAVGIIDGTGDAGEEYYIRLVADRLGLDLHTFQMSADYFTDNYERMVWHNDAPVYRPYFSCFMRLGELAKAHADVLFCGEGADELTGGYSRFAGGAMVPFLSNLQITGSTVRSYRSYAEYAVMAGETITDFTTLGYDNVEGLLQERMDIFHGFAGSDFTKHLKFEIRECLPEASLRQDKMTMASSIQNRAPFLDNELVDLFMTMPEDLLVRFVDVSPLNLGSDPFTWMQGKWVLKEIVAKHFGRDFAYRKKAIMNLNERSMLTDARFVEYAYDQVFPRMKERGLFDVKMLMDRFDRAATISSREFTSLWKAISTETWCQLFLDSK